MRVVVVDYGAANLLSITRALGIAGAEVTVSDDPRAIDGAAGVVLPGVGAAGAAMDRLRATGADAALRRVVADGRPFLGLCLGMQLLFQRLEEDGATGLGMLPGAVRRLPAGLKVPHMGWNTLSWDTTKPGAALFEGMSQGMYAYFVHSYACIPAEPGLVAAWTEYGGPVCAAIASGNLWGCQFHPEKSSRDGLRLLANWVRRVPTAARGARQESVP